MALFVMDGHVYSNNNTNKKNQKKIKVLDRIWAVRQLDGEVSQKIWFHKKIFLSTR